jgi:hypothetical protein
MIKFIISTFIIILVQISIIFYASTKFEIRFLDLMFYFGVLFTVISLFFSSNGGFISNLSDAKVMNSINGMFGGFKHTRSIGNININPFVVGSILLFIFAIILATFFY